MVLEARLLHADETAYAKLEAEASQKAKSLVSLASGGRSYPPCMVNLCRSVVENYECRGQSADDTIHLAEFVEQCPRIETLNHELAVAVEGGAVTELPVFYAGEPREMHSTGYASVKPIALKARQLILPEHAAGEQIVFTIIKRQGDSYFKKLAWVVKRRQPGK